MLRAANSTNVRPRCSKDPLLPQRTTGRSGLRKTFRLGASLGLPGTQVVEDRLHDTRAAVRRRASVSVDGDSVMTAADYAVDRKSTRLNSSHANISYAVFCLKKKKKYTSTNTT